MVDAASRVAVGDIGPMHQRVMTSATDATPILLVAELERPAPFLHVTVRSLVTRGPVQTEGTALGLSDDGGPLLGGLRSKVVTGREPGAKIGLTTKSYPRVSSRTDWTLLRSRGPITSRSVALLSST